MVIVFCDHIFNFYLINANHHKYKRLFRQKFGSKVNIWLSFELMRPSGIQGYTAIHCQTWLQTHLIIKTRWFLRVRSLIVSRREFLNPESSLLLATPDRGLSTSAVEAEGGRCDSADSVRLSSLLSQWSHVESQTDLI